MDIWWLHWLKAVASLHWLTLTWNYIALLVYVYFITILVGIIVLSKGRTPDYAYLFILSLWWLNLWRFQIVFRKFLRGWSFNSNFTVKRLLFCALNRSWSRLVHLMLVWWFLYNLNFLWLSCMNLLRRWFRYSRNRTRYSWWSYLFKIYNIWWVRLKALIDFLWFEKPFFSSCWNANWWLYFNWIIIHNRRSSSSLRWNFLLNSFHNCFNVFRGRNFTFFFWRCAIIWILCVVNIRLLDLRLCFIWYLFQHSFIKSQLFDLPKRLKNILTHVHKVTYTEMLSLQCSCASPSEWSFKSKYEWDSQSLEHSYTCRWFFMFWHWKRAIMEIEIIKLLR